MSKKILAVVLALVMALSACSVFAFADDTAADTVVTADDTVAAWEANLAPVLAELMSNERSAHWSYVAENDKTISDTMTVYTVFALYDDAWANGFDGCVSVDQAEEILVALIEKVDANIGESKFAEILSVLKTASDLNDLLQKVNSYVEISETLTSDSWTKAFKLINYAIKAGDLYEDARDDVIEAYARILSVQAANDLYIDLLQYVGAHTTYDVVAKACENLVGHIESSVEDIIADEVKGQVLVKSSEVLEMAARVAMETNTYTAVALKVYDTATSIADKLWNTSDQYALMDALYTTFFIETTALEWAKLNYSMGDMSKYVFGVGAMLGLRQAGAEALYNLKIAQNDGIVGKVKNQINYNVGFLDVAEMSFLTAAEQALFNTDIADLVKVGAIVTAASGCVFDADGYRIYNTEETLTASNGYFTCMYADAIGNYVKTGLVPAGTTVTLKAGADYLATLIVKRVENGEIADYSFTDVTINAGNSVAVPVDGTTYTAITDEGTETYELNAEYVAPVYNAVTVKSVTNAVVVIAKDEVSDAKDQVTGKVVYIGDLIKSIMSSIVSFLNSIFTVKLFG